MYMFNTKDVSINEHVHSLLNLNINAFSLFVGICVHICVLVCVCVCVCVCVYVCVCGACMSSGGQIYQHLHFPPSFFHNVCNELHDKHHRR